MIILPSHQALRSALPKEEAGPPHVVVIGNFDGVHLGHQALFEQARRCVKGARIIALTFWPHPARVLAPPAVTPPPLILSRQRRRERLAECGVDVLVEQTFDLAFAAISPQKFVDEVLLESLRAAFVVVGHDFTFGKGRAGTTETLAALLARGGAQAAVVPAFTVQDPANAGQRIICSSSFVRREVQAGRPERAALVLGRDVEVEGVAVRGAGRGKGLGIPTANLACEADLRPAIGIYAAWAEVLSAVPAEQAEKIEENHELRLINRKVRERYPAAVSIGYNATFMNGDTALPALSIEAHFLQPSGAPPLPAFYGQTVRLHLKSRLRDEQRFPTVEALLAQIHLDINATKALLGVTW